MVSGQPGAAGLPAPLTVSSSGDAVAVTPLPPMVEPTVLARILWAGTALEQCVDHQSCQSSSSILTMMLQIRTLSCQPQTSLSTLVWRWPSSCSSWSSSSSSDYSDARGLHTLDTASHQQVTIVRKSWFTVCSATHNIVFVSNLIMFDWHNAFKVWTIFVLALISANVNNLTTLSNHKLFSWNSSGS